MFFLDTIKGHVTISQHLQSHLIFMNIEKKTTPFNEMYKDITVI